MLPLIQPDTFTLGGCAAPKRTDPNGHPSTMTISHYPIPSILLALANHPSKLKTRILQGEFIDSTNLLQADFHFKYASVGTQDSHEMVSENGLFIMKPK